MNDQNTHYTIKAEKRIMFFALSTAVLVAGIFLTVSQAGQMQILQQQAQTTDAAVPVDTANATDNVTTNTNSGTDPVAGPTCNGKTKLSIAEARILNGICPDIDPKTKNACVDFCTAAPDSDKCKAPVGSTPGGQYNCETVNQNAGASMGKCQTTPCANGTAQGYCAPGKGTCCKNPPPPAPAAPSGGPSQTTVKPRSSPVAMCNNAKGKCASGCMNYIGECCRSNYPLINNCCQPGCNVYGGTQKAGFTDKTGGKCDTPTVQKFGYCRATSVPKGAKPVDPSYPKDPAIFN